MFCYGFVVQYREPKYSEILMLAFEKTPNNAVMPQSFIVLIVLLSDNCTHFSDRILVLVILIVLLDLYSDQRVQNDYNRVVWHHSIVFWGQTNFKITQNLGNLFSWSSFHEIHETCDSVTFYCMKKNSFSHISRKCIFHRI